MNEEKEKIDSLTSERNILNDNPEGLLGLFIFIWLLIFTVGAIFLLIKLGMWVF